MTTTLPLAPGRELDALVDTLVMGLDLSPLPEHTWDEDCDSEEYYATCLRCGYPIAWGSTSSLRPEDRPKGPCTLPPKPRSTNIAAAWEVLEALRANGWVVLVAAHAEGYEVTLDKTHNTFLSGDYYWELRAPTAPLAICIAALQAVGCHGA